MAASRLTVCVAYFAIAFRSERNVCDVTFGSERTCVFSTAQTAFAAFAQPAFVGAAAECGRDQEKGAVSRTATTTAR